MEDEKHSEALGHVSSRLHRINRGHCSRFLQPQQEQNPSSSREGKVTWMDFVLGGDIICELDSEPFPRPVVDYVDHLIVADGDMVTPAKDIVWIVVGKYVMRDVGHLTSAKCDGMVLSTFFSSLSVMSRFSLNRITFTSY